jgi:hypothetical protein
MTMHCIIKKSLRRLIHSILTATVERLLLSAIWLLILAVLLTLLLSLSSSGGSDAVTIRQGGGCGRSR